MASVDWREAISFRSNRIRRFRFFASRWLLIMVNIVNRASGRLEHRWISSSLQGDVFTLVAAKSVTAR
jgi:hypothetical protein